MRRRVWSRRAHAAAGGRVLTSERWHWDLNGTNEYLLSGDIADSGLDGDVIGFTLGVVARLDTLTDTQTIFERQNSGLTVHNRIRIEWNGTELQIELASSGGGVFKRYTYSGISAGVGFQFAFTYTESTDAVAAYLNGSSVSPASTPVDSAGNIVNPGANSVVTIGARRVPLGVNPINGQVQDVWSFRDTILSAADMSTLYSQRNDSDPLSGFSPYNHWTPQNASNMGVNYGSGSGNVMDAASNITSGDDRIQGNIAP